MVFISEMIGVVAILPAILITIIGARQAHNTSGPYAIWAHSQASWAPSCFLECQFHSTYSWRCGVPYPPTFFILWRYIAASVSGAKEL